MRNNSKSKPTNPWKWLFIVSTIVYISHLSYSFLYSTPSTSSAKKHHSKTDPEIASPIMIFPQELTLEDKKIKELKSHGLVGRLNKPFSGIVNGRNFVIFNNTGHIDSMLANLRKYRALPTAKKTVQIGDYGAKKVSQLRFLHIPKAGKAFASTVIHYCCELLDGVHVDVSMPPSHHVWKFDPSCRPCLMQPVTVNGDYFAFFPYMSVIDKGHAIAMFREPLSRLAFQIDHMRRLRSMMTTFGFTKEEAHLLGLILSGKILEAYKLLFKVEERDVKNMDFTPLIKSPPAPFSQSFISHAAACLPIIAQPNRTSSGFNRCRFQLVALYPGLFGCQTKLVLGRTCVDQRPLTQGDVEIAKERIKSEFLFTGIFEQWNASAILLHKKIGGKMFEDEISSANAPAKIEELRVLQALQESDISDPYDNDLYAFAKKIFDEEWTRLQATSV